MKRTEIKRSTKPMKRGTPMKKKRKDGRSADTRICDYLFLTIIVLRDKTCFCGGRFKGCDGMAYTGHHIFFKTNQHRNLRYDFKNAVGISEHCHGPWHGVHGNPQQYEQPIREWVDRTHGKGTYERLEARAYMTGSKADMYLVEMALWFEGVAYGLYQPDGWYEWKEYKKLNFLREVRKNGRR